VSWGVAALLTDPMVGCPNPFLPCKDAAISQYLQDLLVLANQNGVIVCAAVGNGERVFCEGIAWEDGKPKSVDITYEPVFAALPGCMSGALSVGGAFPTSLADPLSRASWLASTDANSGEHNKDDVSNWPLSTDVIMRFPDLCSIVNMFCPSESGEPCVSWKKTGICVPWGTQSQGGLHIPGTAKCAGKEQGAFPIPGTEEILHGYRVGGGTSFATPCVAGILALLLQAVPQFPHWPPYWGGGTFEDVLAFLRQCCVDVLKGECYPGNKACLGDDVATGAGVLNAALLVGRAIQYDLNARIYGLDVEIPAEQEWPPRPSP